MFRIICIYAIANPLILLFKTFIKRLLIIQVNYKNIYCSIFPFNIFFSLHGNLRQFYIIKSQRDDLYTIVSIFLIKLF